jgi:hypothetical protein
MGGSGNRWPNDSAVQRHGLKGTAWSLRGLEFGARGIGKFHAPINVDSSLNFGRPEDAVLKSSRAALGIAAGCADVQYRPRERCPQRLRG